ncbi:MAG TPA: hypothetical protein VIF57_05100 [Polyangia bacterium]
MSAFAALAVLYAQAARGDVADAGVPAADASAVTADAGAADAAPADAAPAPPPRGELATPPELATTTTAAALTTTPLVDTPTPAEAEPPRPITRRLWFWMAITGLVITGVAIGLAVQNPTVKRPDCPGGYVCPL